VFLQVNGSAVGFCSLTCDVDLAFLRRHYDLTAFNDLKPIVSNPAPKAKAGPVLSIGLFAAAEEVCLRC
jgi:hypothetical protein